MQYLNMFDQNFIFQHQQMLNYSEKGYNKAIQKAHNPQFGQIYRKFNLSESAIKNYVVMQKLGISIKLVKVTKDTLQMRKGLCVAYLIDLGLINKDFADKFEAAVHECRAIMKSNKVAHCDIKPQNVTIFADNQIEGIHITSTLDSFKQIWQRQKGKLSDSALSIQKIGQDTLSQFKWRLKIIDNDDLKKYGELRQVITPGINGFENQFGKLVDQNTDLMGWTNTINYVKNSTGIKVQKQQIEKAQTKRIKQKKIIKVENQKSKKKLINVQPVDIEVLVVDGMNSYVKQLILELVKKYLYGRQIQDQDQKQVAQNLKQGISKRQIGTWHCIVGMEFVAFVTSTQMIFLRADQLYIQLWEQG